ncbi:MAG: hypothetical protein K2G96_02815 [Clostridia bacterium]|nr:hypothetical protein [Clostridia bacterium]
MKKIIYNTKCKFFVCAVLIVFIIASLSFCLTSLKLSYAEESNNPLSSASNDINVQSYRLEDNTGYYATEDAKVPAKTHPLLKNLINLSVYTQSDLTQAKIDGGNVSGFDGYGITGDSVAIQLCYNFDNAENMIGENDETYSISSDTYQSIGEHKEIGVIGTGALLFQKKYNPNDSW